MSAIAYPVRAMARPVRTIAYLVSAGANIMNAVAYPVGAGAIFNKEKIIITVARVSNS